MVKAKPLLGLEPYDKVFSVCYGHRAKSRGPTYIATSSFVQNQRYLKEVINNMHLQIEVTL